MLRIFKQVDSPQLASRRWAWWGVLLMVGVLTGCGERPPVKFRLDMQGRDPALFEASDKDNAKNIENRQRISTALTALFGTPDDPYVFPEAGLDLYKIRLAAGAVSSNQDGQHQGLYRRHCAHCHGITGDGAGPTAAFLTPYPRDYRKGVFKFKSDELAQKPSTDDLHRVLREGINGTAMPSFLLLAEQERDALVEYVKYLSMRGELEILLWALADGDSLELTKEVLVDDGMKSIGAMWSEESSPRITVPEHPPVPDQAKWLAAGSELFRGAKAQCTKCHGPTGLGDGSEELLFDDWNKEKKQTVLRKEIAQLESDLSNFQAPPGAKSDEISKMKSDLQTSIAGKKKQLNISLHTYLLPEQQLQPRNLRQGIYRFGRSDGDTYRRIHAGIAGTPMPAGGKSLSPTEIWQIVDYVRTLPYDTFTAPAKHDLSVSRPRN